MTICRFYLQGTCRFGDRCRFEHPENNYVYYDQTNTDNYQQRQGYGQSNNYRQGNNQYRSNRYDSNDYYNDRQRSYSPNRYSDDYRHESKYSSNVYKNQQYNKFKNDYEEYSSYTDSNYGRNQQYADNRNLNTYGQNRFRWLSDDYKKEVQQNVPRENKSRNQDFSTSTPKGKISFSFKLPESEIKKDSGFSRYPIDEQDQLHVEGLKEDAMSWELGGMWPFTCYFPYSDKYGFPGFWDVSPEELRYAAYKAEENNAYDTYVQSVQNALVEITQHRSQLKVPTPELLATIRRIRGGDNAFFLPKTIASIPFLQSDGGITPEDIELPAATATATNAATSFSFKMASDSELSTKPSSANFSFKLPTVSASSSVIPPASSGDPDVYTPLESLTEEEKEQFMASTFELGKIPTKPPPQMLCS